MGWASGEQLARETERVACAIISKSPFTPLCSGARLEILADHYCASRIKRLAVKDDLTPPHR